MAEAQGTGQGHTPRASHVCSKKNQSGKFVKMTTVLVHMMDDFFYNDEESFSCQFFVGTGIMCEGFPRFFIRTIRNKQKAMQ
jgi:hypothetical protein